MTERGLFDKPLPAHALHDGTYVGRERASVSSPGAVSRLRAEAFKIASARDSHEMTIDPLRFFAESQGITMKPNAWGSIFTRSEVEGYHWIDTGRSVKSVWKPSKKRKITVWSLERTYKQI